MHKGRVPLNNVKKEINLFQKKIMIRICVSPVLGHGPRTAPPWATLGMAYCTDPQRAGVHQIVSTCAQFAAVLRRYSTKTKKIDRNPPKPEVEYRNWRHQWIEGPEYCRCWNCANARPSLTRAIGVCLVSTCPRRPYRKQSSHLSRKMC